MIEPHKPGAILFDLDGTLVDTLPDMVWSMNRLLGEIGRRTVTIDELRRWVGDGVTPLVERGLAATGGEAGAPLSSMVERFLAHYKSHLAVDSRAYPGVEPTLRALQAAGHRLGVCTNKPTALSSGLLTSLGLSPHFAAITGGDAVAKRKPHPEHIFAALDAISAPARGALMVGDSANDVAAARAAGLPVLVVRFGYSRIPVEDLGADAVIDSFAQLPETVKRLAAGVISPPVLDSSEAG